VSLARAGNRLLLGDLAEVHRDPAACQRVGAVLEAASLRLVLELETNRCAGQRRPVERLDPVLDAREEVEQCASQDLASSRRTAKHVLHDPDRLVVHVGEAQAGVERVDPVRDGGQDRVEAPPLGQVAHDRRQRERLTRLRIVDAEPVPRDRDPIARLEVLQRELPRLTAVSED
jgi:hypothetical protein